MDSSPNLRVGAATVDITPPIGVAHANWGAARHSRAAGLDFPFAATVLWVSDGDSSIVLCDLDRGLVPTPEADRIRGSLSDLLDVPRAGVRISYTHTHSGPLISQSEGRRSGPGRELVEAYQQSVHDQLLGAARFARRDARPVVHDTGYGRCGIGVNRRRWFEDRVVVGEEPAGVTDETVLVSRFRTVDGEPVATILGFAAHPTSLGHENQLLSPDYPGFARTELRRLTGAPVLFLQGSAGDQMARHGFVNDVEVPRRLGRQLAYVAASTYLALDLVGDRRDVDQVLESGAPLALLVPRQPPSGHTDRVGAISVGIDVPVRAHPSELDSETKVADAISALEAAREADDGPAMAEAMMRAKRSETALFFARWLGGRTMAELEMQVLRVGDLGLVGVPAEPFAQIGINVRDRSPFPYTQMAGYTNGWQGYIATAEEYERGGYEIETASVFGKAAGSALQRSSLELLHQLWKS